MNHFEQVSRIGASSQSGDYVTVAPGVRIVIPSRLRKLLDVRPGDRLRLEMHGDELRIRTARARMLELQEIVTAHAPEGRSLVDFSLGKSLTNF